MGPELLRVKDLARKSNSFDEEDYAVALKLLFRVPARKYSGIIISRGAAGRELVPSAVRSPTLSDPASDDSGALFDHVALPSSDVIGTLIDGCERLERESFFIKRALSPLDL